MIISIGSGADTHTIKCYKCIIWRRFASHFLPPPTHNRPMSTHIREGHTHFQHQEDDWTKKTNTTHTEPMLLQKGHRRIVGGRRRSRITTSRDNANEGVVVLSAAVEGVNKEDEPNGNASNRWCYKKWHRHGWWMWVRRSRFEFGLDGLDWSSCLILFPKKHDGFPSKSHHHLI